MTAVAAALATAATAAAATREQVLLYTSDWSGTEQVYAVRTPASRPRLAQITRGRPARCPAGHPCGYDRVVPSPDGRRIAYWDYVAQGYWRWQLFVARANGAGPRRVAESRSLFREAVWSPDSRRLAYSSSDGIHVVRADGSGDVALPRRGSGDGAPGSSELAADWSAAGYLAFRDGSTVVVRGRDLSPLASVEGDGFAWSHSGRRLAIQSDGRVSVIRPDGSGRRRIGEELYGRDLAWSADDRYLALHGRNGVAVAGAETGTVRDVAPEGSVAWSPRAPLLGVATRGGLVLVDARSGRSRMLVDDRANEAVWSPDGRSLAYLACGVCGSPFWSDRDLRIADLSGTTRTVVSTAGTGGGSIRGLAWTRAPVLRYRPLAPRALASVTPGGLRAPQTIDRLAADGDRVAYSSCGHAFVWTPRTGTVVEAGSASLAPRCNSPAYYAGFGLTQLALAGDRVATTWIGGGNTTFWWLAASSVSTGATVTLGEGSATTGRAYRPWRGAIAALPAGARDVLVFSNWTETDAPGEPSIHVSSQTIRLAPPAGCPCPEVGTSPGPLVPFDVDDGRVLAGGDNETIVYGPGGEMLARIPVSPAAAQLDGADVVVARPGELRHYDAATGEPRHRWTLPDAAVAAPCTRFNCAPGPVALVLHDLARGLAAYALRGEIHVVRLRDGTDTTVTAGTAARFMDAGLVVLDGRELRLLPYERLPQP